eukprot:TRINITY_DN1430_c0_g1_i1.p1 TRINITY_DN1430_c0_g1~~TRINITY_DN1430_c0_g1_i1.p1  ORF type:complete len:472 (+),score=94.80 TRINITY_DN1430_c0_g1_i1:42-1418(+)
MQSNGSKGEKHLNEGDFRRNYWALFIFGTLNNLPYSIILSACKNIAKRLGYLNESSALPWANVTLSLFTRSLNAFFLENFTYTSRVIINGLMMPIGCLGMILSLVFAEQTTGDKFPFFVGAIFSTVLIGGSSAFGESVLLGFLRQYDPDLVAGWSSGTGMAGVGAAGLYLLLDELEVPDKIVFCIVLPLFLVYLFSFFVLLKPPPPQVLPDGSIVCSCSYKHGRYSEWRDLEFIQNHLHDLEPELKEKVVQELSNLNPKEMLIDEETAEEDEEEKPLLHSSEVKESVFTRIFRCLKLTMFHSTMLAGVYFFEYCIITNGAKHANLRTKESNNFEIHAFEILGFCYQIGVLISRSSLTYFKLKPSLLYLPTLLQLVNFFLWLYQDLHHTFNIYIQIIHMIFVGLMGGLGYVQLFYDVLHTNKIPTVDRELCVNIVAIWITIGTMGSCFYGLMVDKSLFS